MLNCEIAGVVAQRTTVLRTPRDVDARGHAAVHRSSPRSSRQGPLPRRTQSEESSPSRRQTGAVGGPWTQPRTRPEGVSMIRSRPMTFLAGGAVIPLAALVVAGCGGGGGGASASTTPPKTTSPISARAAVVRVANSRLGKILVDSQGRTLYLFQKDSGNKSACTGPCAGAWPPLRADGKPTVGSGAKASLVGTTTRSDGGPQVTYNGHPLYLFVK